MRSLLIPVSMLFGFAAMVSAAKPIEFDKSQLIGGEVPRQYRPDYPYAARIHHQTGSGIFVLHVDPKTGEVASITVQKSTGYKLLDNAALTACVHWRFKPHTVTDVWLPMTFSMRGGLLLQEWAPHGAGD
jgi:TonB family protein